MYEKLNQELQQAQQDVMRLQKVNSMLEELKKQKETLTEKLEEQKRSLAKEDLDVEKLESKGLAHVFYSMLGNLEEHLEKERKEALAVRLKYDQAIRELDQVNYDISGLTTEKEKYRNAEITYKELYSRKKELLLASNSETAERMLDITDQTNKLTNLRKEIQEAIRAGKGAVTHLNNAAANLDSAEGWGTWDLLGGGLLTDLAKHSKIDDAKYEVEETQRALSRFRTELADVKISGDIYIETDGFGKFTDFFFDGLIADWCMQSRIHDAQGSVAGTKSKVEQVLEKLSRMENEVNGKLEGLEREMKELITGASR